MRSPTTMLVWEIWRKKHGLAWLVVALISFGWVFNSVCGVNFRATESGREWLNFLDGMLCVWSMIFVFGIFNYTEFNPQKQWTGFPYHLFTLPVRTWKLVALPMVTGVVVAEITFLAWLKLVFTHNEPARPEWFAVLIGAYLVFFQTILWTLAAFRMLRIIILSLVGTSVVGVGFMPFFSKITPAWWLSEKVLAAALAAMTLLSYVTAWNVVARQRRGGGRRESWFKIFLERALDLLPRRRSAFNSAASAQLWFEWRRAGLLLPTIVGALLILVVAPLSWNLRDDANTVPWILPQMLAMPIVLAAAIGKNFSKADFWSKGLALPSFVAARPMATGDMVVAKLKAAALSVALTWALVLAFLCLWLPLWAKLDAFNMVRLAFWMDYDHSVYPQYIIATLAIGACMLLTWKFLVGGLCVGLSGSRKLYFGSAAAYGVLAILGIVSFATLLNHDQKFLAWVRHDPNQLLSVFEWTVAAGVIVKFWLAAYSWRRNSRKRVLQYLVFWCGATSLFVVFERLIWAKGSLTLMLTYLFDILPMDPIRLERFLILIALLAVPFARLGFAPAALTRNRRGDFAGKDES